MWHYMLGYWIGQKYLKLMSACMMSDLESNIYVRMISGCVSATSLRFFVFWKNTLPIGEWVQVYPNFLYSQRWIVWSDWSTSDFKWWAAARTRTCFNCCCIDGCSGTDQLDWTINPTSWIWIIAANGGDLHGRVFDMISWYPLMPNC